MRRPVAIEDLALSLPPKARLIGIDLGSKTIGLAISDVERRIASPLRTLPRGAFATNAKTLTAIFSEHDIAGIVLGLPLDLDGRDNPRAQSTRAFGRNLSSRTDLPIVLWLIFFRAPWIGLAASCAHEPATRSLSQHFFSPVST
jgi:putative Holliday junction resolvase